MNQMRPDEGRPTRRSTARWARLAALAALIVTKMPYPDLGDPWTARQQLDPRWYALETAKALVQAAWFREVAEPALRAAKARP